ncbi:MAG: hypothetical protein PHP23_11190 [Desulfobacterales bacterium]|nr:hypothetical protein [Desulfobacterales bacterium]MDD4073530.1 hypothetical protein [Desulfobacterales bacterium]MDD4391603.1 hypothetical protein [Desulfobacterales bacterium]
MSDYQQFGLDHSCGHNVVRTVAGRCRPLPAVAGLSGTIRGDAGAMKLKRKNSASLKPFVLLNASWPRHFFPRSCHVVRRQRPGLQNYT